MKNLLPQKINNSVDTNLLQSTGGILGVGMIKFLASGEGLPPFPIREKPVQVSILLAYSKWQSTNERPKYLKKYKKFNYEIISWNTENLLWGNSEFMNFFLAEQVIVFSIINFCILHLYLMITQMGEGFFAIYLSGKILSTCLLLGPCSRNSTLNWVFKLNCLFEKKIELQKLFFTWKTVKFRN